MSAAMSPMELIEEKRRELVDRYLKGLEVRILDLENAAVALRKNPGDVDSLIRVGAVCHKLAGISASVGQPEIGRLAGEIDDMICSKSARWADIENILENLLETMEGQLK